MTAPAVTGDVEVEAWVKVLRSAVTGRRWILTGDLGALGPKADELVRLGAAGVLLVGYGARPIDFTGPVIEVRRPDGGARELDYVMARSPVQDDEVLRRFDADREALVLGGGFYTGATLWDRPYIGGRRAEWQALEDKTAVDRLWDDMGTRRSPSAIVAAQFDQLVAAADDLDTGAGTVWSGERSGRRPADGCELVFWVKGRTQARHAARALLSADKGARVMPFLEGVPCSIHGIVGTNGAAIFRPVEIVSLPRPAGGFIYAGTDTWWDPPQAQREEMRALARLAGAHLQRRFGYRGAFTVDGVLGPDGFLPTELNPRWAAGLWPQAMVCPVPLRLIESLVTSGLDGPMESLERLVVNSADATRFGGPTLQNQVRATEATLFLARRGVSFVLTTSAETAAAQLTVSGPTGGANVVVRPVGQSLLGKSLRPLARAAFAVADEVLGTRTGPFR